ncbi:hypothetical protein NDU88_003130 [Pleurodeles waltl]|uniref:Uncharacterized protein n=1 Tax=Pleurodeles waltl TaxID=8319 RepID=A0AAV7MZA7_PLEWA|nr:hypothetical protein NDU88_003130 [Pleurodeles waltl]
MFMCRQPGAIPGTTRRISQQAPNSGPHLLQSQRSQKAHYCQPGPALPCRGPRDRKVQGETPAEGRERPMRPEPPAPHSPGANR